jgi:hypothetical protein
MNADDLKKLPTESLKELAALLEQGRSERLIMLLKTMGRFHQPVEQVGGLAEAHQNRAVWSWAAPCAQSRFSASILHRKAIR